MAIAYDPTEWHDLFGATAGASSALAGLLFVAVSINIERILQFKGLAERGLETLVLLLVVLFISIAGLVPGQSHVVLGLELIAIAALLVVVVAKLTGVGKRPSAVPRWWVPARLAIKFSGPTLLAIGGLTELLAVTGGLYWVAAAIAFLILGGVSNAWVLLVEILR